jgi:hypothetical protein
MFARLLVTDTLFKLSVFLLASDFIMLACLANSSKTPVWRLLGLLLLAVVPYGIALFSLYKDRKGICVSTWAVVCITLGLRLILVLAPPVFSDDVYRYIWDGRVVAAGINPYHFTPEAPELESMRDVYWNGINHRYLRTIYPPLGEMIFGVTSWISPRPIAFKLASAVADTLVVYLIMLLAGGSKGRVRKRTIESRVQDCRSSRLGLTYGLFPLACVETGMSGHLEPFAIALTLVSIFFIKKNKHLISVVFLGFGTCVKLLPILLLPFITRGKILSMLVFFAVVIACYLPFLAAGTGTVDTLDAFARRWEGNGGLFELVKTGVEVLVGFIYGVDSRDGMIHLSFMDSVAQILQGTFFSLHKDGGFDSGSPGAFTLGDISLAITKLIMACVLVAVVVGVIRLKVEVLEGAGWIFGTLVIITPVLHPWYVLWVLPFAALKGIWPFFVFASVLPLAYLPLDNWWKLQSWDPPAWVPWLEFGVLFIAFAVYTINRINRAKRPETCLGTGSLLDTLAIGDESYDGSKRKPII